MLALVEELAEFDSDTNPHHGTQGNYSNQYPNNRIVKNGEPDTHDNQENSIELSDLSQGKKQAKKQEKARLDQNKIKSNDQVVTSGVKAKRGNFIQYQEEPEQEVSNRSGKNRDLQIEIDEEENEEGNQYNN